MSAPCKAEEARVTLAPRVERDWSHLVQPDRIHQSLYTDPALFPHEMIKLFGGLWTYLCHESELPAANAFKRVRLGLRPVVMTRDKGGTIHGLFNRCAHRAATICQEDAGAAARFTCPYHGWTYANDGRLIGVPFDEGYGDAFDKSLHGLRRIPRIETYRGFVFGTLNPDMPSLTDHLGAATELMLTMCPLFCARICGSTAWIQCSEPKKFTLSCEKASLGSVNSTAPEMPKPALLTSRSI